MRTEDATARRAADERTTSRFNQIDLRLEEISQLLSAPTSNKRLRQRVAWPLSRSNQRRHGGRNGRALGARRGVRREARWRPRVRDWPGRRVRTSCDLRTRSPGGVACVCATHGIGSSAPELAQSILIHARDLCRESSVSIRDARTTGWPRSRRPRATAIYGCKSPSEPTVEMTMRFRAPVIEELPHGSNLTTAARASELRSPGRLPAHRLSTPRRFPQPDNFAE
jgi:hypothetical protein